MSTISKEAAIISAKMLRSMVPPKTHDVIKQFSEESAVVSKLFCDFVVKARKLKLPEKDIERIYKKIDDLHKELNSYEDYIKVKY